MKDAGMQDHLQSPEAAGWLVTIAAFLAKLLPPALGVAIMAMVDKPDTNKELLVRLFVALTCSFLFGDVAFDFAKANFDMLAFLNPDKRSHTFAVEAVVGGCAYSALAVTAKYMRKWRANPEALVEDVKGLKP